METILVHETDAATLEVLTLALQTEGHRVRSVPDNNDNILDMIRRYHPKLVLLDCGLRRYSGKQISHWIKSHFPRLPVIAFSCDHTIDQEYRRLGFDGYLEKPLNLDTFYQLIRQYLPRRRKHHKVNKPG